MEFLQGKEGIVPAPGETPDAEHLAKTQAAVNFFNGNTDAVLRFAARAREKRYKESETVITLVDADDPNGSILADALMPGHNWQRYRDAGETPVARGLASKAFVHYFLMETGFLEAAEELRTAEDIRTVVLHAGVALVLEVDHEKGLNPSKEA